MNLAILPPKFVTHVVWDTCMYIPHDTHFEEYCFLSTENKLMHNTMPLCITDSDLVLNFFPNIKILKKNC